MADNSTRKRKRVSKNKKKTWRKTDISEVEEYLEDKRLQERTGGLVAEKPDEALFFIDKETVKDEVPTKRSRREPRTLRCFANLEPNPRIKAASKSVNIRTAHTYEKKKSIRVKEREAKGIVTITAKKAKEQKKKATAASIKKMLDKRQPLTADYDLWGTGEKAKAPADDEYHKRITKKLPIKKPAHTYKKPSGLPAIEMAHPGASYNPAYEDHVELLQMAHEIEVKKDREEKRITRSLDEKFPSKAEAPTHQTWVQEMSAGLYEEASDNEDVGDVDKLSVNPPVRRENKKTVTQRNKEKKARELEEKRKKDKESRIKDTEIFRLRSFKKAVTEREKDLAEKARRKAELKEKNKDNTKVLGKMKFEAPDVEIKLGDELRGSLRLLKPEGHLMEDRFKSFQKRNIIEPRLRAKYKKTYKDKKFEKNTHREITL
ncbi:ribosome biogenesis protein NOP53-like [Lineus longissimus]|uniref:ribosome biogenesis protein NOP53-like n=1 Tax=Lineus longissimus TaxID=88925 RepID=UPI002B4D746E